LIILLTILVYYINRENLLYNIVNYGILNSNINLLHTERVLKIHYFKNRNIRGFLGMYKLNVDLGTL